MNLFVRCFYRMILPAALLPFLLSLNTHVCGNSESIRYDFAIVDINESSRTGANDGERKQGKVKIHLCIPTLLELEASRAKISFEDIDGPGVYEGDRVIALSLTTNTTAWRVLCDTAIVLAVDSLRTDIPLARIRWKLTGAAAEPFEAAGVLALGVTFLEGYVPVEDLRANLSFSIELLSTDMNLASTYNLKISLIGNVDSQ